MSYRQANAFLSDENTSDDEERHKAADVEDASRKYDRKLGLATLQSSVEMPSQDMDMDPFPIGANVVIERLTLYNASNILTGYPLKESRFSAWFEPVGAPLKLNIDSAFSEKPEQADSRRWIKLLRAHGECLGARSRTRA